MIMPMVGTFTGFKSGVFSVSLNQRTPSNHWNLIDLFANLERIFRGIAQTSWTIRDALESCSDYDCAYYIMTSVEFVAPCYIVIAGTKGNEGVVITRDRQGIANVTTLSDEKWYLAQTNQDHYTGVCPIRCQTANHNFTAIGRENLTVENMYRDVLEVWPLLNFKTIYSAVMIPS